MTDYAMTDSGSQSDDSGDDSPLGYSKRHWLECAYIINFKMPIPKMLDCDGLQVTDLYEHPSLRHKGLKIDLNATPTMTCFYKSGFTHKVVAPWQSQDQTMEFVSFEPEKKFTYHILQE